MTWPAMLQVIAVCKSADLLLMVLDAVKPISHREILTRELHAVGIRLNRDPPKIYLQKKKTGGIGFNSTVTLTHMDEKMVLRVMQEYKIHNADILFKEDATVDDFIDVLEVDLCRFALWGRKHRSALPPAHLQSQCIVMFGFFDPRAARLWLTCSCAQGNRRYIKCLYVYNKVDMLSIEEVDEIARRPNSLPVSCYLELNMDMLLARMWSMMGLVRVYTKKVC
jgi:uncharacterized protein